MQTEGRSVYQDICNVQREDTRLHRDMLFLQRSDPVMPPERSGGQSERHFMHQHRPNMPSEGHFMHQDRYNVHGEGPVMHQDRLGDRMGQLGDNGPLPWQQHPEHGPGSGADVDNEAHQQAQQWLSTFLARRCKKLPTKSEPVKCPSITEARELVYGALRLVSQLTALCQDLERVAEDGEALAQEYPKADSIRKELERKMKGLEEPGYIDGLKRKLGRVRKKRLRQQRGKQETEEEKEEAERAAEREARIDRWRMRRIQQVEEKKRERELKAAADSVLSEVRKKQADVKRMLEVLRALEKLRKLRKEAAARKGVFPPPSADETFENHIRRLRTMVQKRTALYDAEERALRVMLEGEQEEERQREKEKKHKREREKLQQQQREVPPYFWRPYVLPPAHPLQPFRHYYLQAEHSVVSLVHIRHDWDQFLAPAEHPDASSVPRGWVLPGPPTSDTWATALTQAE
ncbi:hypothetical protein FKM82_017935 [Ascaphus truei]